MGMASGRNFEQGVYVYHIMHSKVRDFPNHLVGWKPSRGYGLSNSGSFGYGPAKELRTDSVGFYPGCVQVSGYRNATIDQ
jgi:hypothetical protein